MPNRLLALRLHHGYSQQQLADALGTTKLTIGRWERGEMLPRSFYLQRLGQLFACQPHDLGFTPQPAALAPAVPLVGRDDVLARIKARLCQPQRRVVCTALNGLPGVGKSHLIAAVGHDLIQQGHTVLWTSTSALVQRLLVAKRELRLPQELARLDRVACLILDDIGYVQQDREEMEVLFTLLDERYERRSVLITTNLVFSAWERIFKDPMTTLVVSSDD